jgi:thiazole biosynthesis enzyme
MTTFDEAGISRAILRAYHQKLDDHLISDVVIVGAGPSGMVAAHDLAKRGYKVAIIEMRLATGGGIWGGAMSMNEVVIQEEAKQILDEFEIGTTEVSEGLYTADSVEMSTGLCYRALRAGAKVFNMTTVEDICIHDSIVTGVVINRTSATANLPIDPLMLTARATVDGTGHDTVLIDLLQRRGLLKGTAVSERLGDGPMNVVEGEKFVVEKAGEVFPGLWICGMSVCATYGGPRMGPIFGGMLLSGRRLGGMLVERLGQPASV